MEVVEVKVQRDYLERLASSKKPLAAIAELIWNALDADADKVAVRLLRNSLGGIDRILVEDDGHGLNHGDASEAFANLGGSWKRHSSRTLGGRILHGKQGRGRFLAFSLGDKVAWRTRYLYDGEILEYEITGTRNNLKRFELGLPAKSQQASRGTEVLLTGIHRQLPSLETPKCEQRLNQELALYMRQYPQVRIHYDGTDLDPSAVEHLVRDYELEPVELETGGRAEASLTIIEWTIPTERALFLCDEHGFALSRMSAGIHAPGYNFTAYVKSAYLRELDGSGDLALEELHPDLKRLSDSAREQMRAHFRERASEDAVGLVEEWKREEIYPYDGDARSTIEEAERQVFDVLALNVHEYLPDFGESSRENRRLSFRLLRNAIETSPEAVQTILQDVLLLPPEKQKELVELLERTSLESIINASRVVADRLDFLQGLEILLFSEQGRKKTLERRHLHRIVAEHTWLFGEEFNLTVSDKSLTAVLRRHLDLTERQLLDDSPVVREDGSTGIVDLMFSRVVPQTRAEDREHLIVELKRPSVSIGGTEANQVKNYAAAVAKDARFRDTQTRWEFWAVSNDCDESVRMEASQAGRPPGLLMDVEDLRLRIWVKTWGQLIEGCKARLRFFQERLNYVADEQSGLEYLRSLHARYLPEFAREEHVVGHPGRQPDKGATISGGAEEPRDARSLASVRSS